MKINDAVQSRLGAMQKKGLIVAVIGVALLAVGGVTDSEQFFRSYLYAYIFWFGISAGSLAVLMLHNLTAGEWGFAIRKFLEAGAKTLPFMLILFVPILLGMHHIYEWTHTEVVEADHILHQKAPYLNESFFMIRVVAYFVIWIGLATIINRLITRQEKTLPPAAPKPLRSLQRISGVGVLIFFLTMTFASVDWIMSLEPHWYSTIYGILTVIGQALATFAVFTILLVSLSSYKPFSDYLHKGIFHDLGNFMLALTMLWAYMSLSQFLITWSGNLAEEAPWYIARMNGGWGLVAWGLIIFHFAVPFLVLLSRNNKRNPQILRLIAVFIILVRFVDLFWVTKPAFNPGEFSIHWLDIVAPIALGGIWYTLFLWQLKGKPELPVYDPRMARSAYPESQGAGVGHAQPEGGV